MSITLRELNIYDPYNTYAGRFLDDRFKYNQLHDKLRKIPVRFRDFIFDTAPGDFIKNRVSIGLGLNENQSKELAILTLELILADIYLGNVVSEIKNRLVIDQIKAKTIAGLIVAELFKPILEELKKKHLEKFAKNMPLQPQQQNDDRTVDLRQ